MPLTYSQSWSFDKSRSRMYKQGHYACVKRPTGEEVYKDAARILEELLEKQLDRRGQGQGRPRRNVTDPFPGAIRRITAGDVLDERAELEANDGIERSKTMPSRPRPSRDEKLKDNDLDKLRTEAYRRGGSPSASSADTEGDSAIVSENRQKKSLFKKAKDRLRHAFHRQEREYQMKGKDKGQAGEKGSPKSESPRKWTSPKKSSKDRTDSKDKQSLNGHPQPVIGSKEDSPQLTRGDDRKRRFTLDVRSGSPSSQTEENGKRRNSAGRLLNSIRRSIPGRKDRHLNSHDAASDFAGDGSIRPSTDGRQLPSDKYAPPPPPPQSGDKSSTPSPHHDEDSLSRSTQNGDLLNTLGLPSSNPHDKSPSPFPHSTSTDSHYNAGNRSSSLNSYISAGSHTHNGRNVLDDPGDDIKFIDMDDAVEVLGKGGMDVAKGGGSGIYTPEGVGHTSQEERRHHRPLQPQSSLVVDGDTNDGEEPDGKFGSDGVPLHERTEEEKEFMYEEIAKKLMDMGDNYATKSGFSDSESHQEGAPQAAGGGTSDYTDLVNELVKILRDKGDGFEKESGGASPADLPPEVTQEIEAVKAQTYQRFQRTIQHSLGNEVSWNHLALLFYTTKGVVSAVGLGSQYANSVKEMTLRYFSDKFAGWIMDQGGFDSVLSESDSELD